MLRILLGVLIGAAATATYMQRPMSARSSGRATGRVDELSSGNRNPIADPAVNAGDGTPSLTGMEDQSHIVTP